MAFGPISQFSHSVMSNFLGPHGLQHSRLPCPSPTPEACSNSCPLTWWCHPTLSSSVVPLYCLKSFPASGSFPMGQFFASDLQNIGPITSWQIEGKQVETVTDFIFLGSKITADGDCSHEIKTKQNKTTTKKTLASWKESYDKAMTAY